MYTLSRCSIIKAMKQGRDGFTLVEVLVVISITAILTALAIGYSKVNERQLVLFSERAKIQGMLSRAKVLALQGAGREEDSFGVCYGIEFDTSVLEGPDRIALYRSPATTDACKLFAEGTVIDEQPLDIRLRIEVDADQGGVVFRSPRAQVFSGAHGTPLADDLDLQLRYREEDPAVDPWVEFIVSSGGSVSTEGHNL